MKLTEKQSKILDILKTQFGGSAFAEDIVEKVEGITVQSVRATLSSLAPKGLVSKNKEARGEKMLTKYTVIEKAE